MTHTEEQLRALLDQAEAMPYGAGRLALVEQVITHADAQRLTEVAFDARMLATTAYVLAGEPTRALVTFAWCVAEFDRDPTTHRTHQLDLLWQFKYAVGALTRSPEVPLEQTYAVLDDMQRRWLETGHSLHAVYSHRHRVARHVGDFETAQRYYTLWCAAPRDELSDCSGCDPEMKAYWLATTGRHEEAVALAEPVLSGRMTCLEQPQSMLTTLMTSYVRTGRLDQARDAHRRAYRAHRTQVADLAEIADHVAFCARTGNEARAVEIVQRHLGWLDRAPSPWAEMLFAAAAAHALRRAVSALFSEVSRVEDRDLALRRPGSGERLDPTALADELGSRAAAIAARFDRRNGTDRVSTLVHEIVTAPPLVDYLPLSAVAVTVPTSDLLALAVEHLGAHRYLDAADVAEEELARRLRAGEDADPVRHVLATVYARLDRPDEALAELDTILAQPDRDLLEIGRTARQAGEILDLADRDDEAAQRFVTAAEAFARTPHRVDELECRRQHARSLLWAFGAREALPALHRAQELATLLRSGEGLARQLALLDYDSARILWGVDDLARAADRADRAARALGTPRLVADARIVQARILLDAGDAAAAEVAARQAIAALPEEFRLPAYVEVLAEAVRRQGRDPGAVWVEHGLTPPSTEDDR